MMKKLFLALLVSCNVAIAGPTSTPSPLSSDTPPPWSDTLETIGAAIFAARAGSLAVYPSYDPYITVNGNKDPWGFGAALLYPVSKYAFAGIRVDFLTHTFWAPSAVVGAKYTLDKFPFHPTVFSVAGLILPLGGAQDQNHVAEGVAGMGLSLTFWQDKSGHFSFSGFAEGEKWTNFKGVIVHPGLGIAYTF